MHSAMKALALAAVLGGAAMGASAAAATTLKIATIAPDGTVWMKTMREAAAEIERRTDGRVKLKFYPGGVMGSERAVLRKMRFGQLDGGAFSGGSLGHIYPDVNIYGLPFVFRSLEEVDYARQRLDERVKAGFREAGYVVAGIMGNGFAYLMSKRPLRTVSDLEKAKVWMPEGDEISRVTFESGGISPIALPISDVYTALQTGMVDTVANTTAGAIAFQWHTQVNYVTELPLSYVIAVLMFSERSFDRLESGDQAIVDQVISEAADKLDRATREDNRDAREALQSQGIELLEPSAEGRAHWREVAERAIDKLERQGAVSSRMRAALRGHLADFRKEATGAVTGDGD